MVLLITYDQDHEGRPERHGTVHQIVEMHADDFLRPMFTQWLVETDESALEWLEHVQPVIDYDDNVLIVELTENYAGFLKDEAWEWLRARV